MHHCLSISEILVLVCDNVCPPLATREGRLLYDEYVRTSIHDLCSFSQTCRTINGPALDALWRTQWSLGPLLMCMPAARTSINQGLLVSQGDKVIKVSLASPPGPSGWHAISPLACRIRKLVPFSPLRTKFIVNSVTLSTLLSSCPLPTLLPNLSTLTHLVTPTFTPNITFCDGIGKIFASRLEVLVLDLPDRLSPNQACAIANLLKNRCPQLKKLSLYVSSQVPFVDLIGPLSAASIQTLVLLNNLHDLTTLFLNTPLPYLPFHRMHTLKLECRSPQMIDLLRSIQAPTMCDLELCVFDGSHSSPQYHRNNNLLAILGSQTRWLSTLQSLTISYCGGLEFLPFTVQPLFAFGELRHLKIIGADLSLTASILEEVIRAWPHLESLILARSLRHLESEEMLPFISLFLLAACCRNIQTLALGMKMDASMLVRRSPTLPQTPAATPSVPNTVVIQKESVHIAILRGSPIVDPVAVLIFLRALYPTRHVRLDLSSWDLVGDHMSEKHMWMYVKRSLEGS
ncbi:hypothetical protein HYDPIDRAFT_26298 [Hydnomerulius pinastri MD-312]|nr:hypothetical protein HYDPIDRAFT_26298 [Hydnomerulius pinastri MD-312]